jgi:hypothetical protein
MSATAWLENARDQLDNTPAGVFLPSTKNVFELSHLASVTYQRQTNYSPAAFAPSGLNLYFLQGVGRIGFGSFRSPSFLNDQGVIPAAATGVDVDLPIDSKEIPFVVFFPDQPAPPGGYPVVIAGHGADMYDLLFGNAVASNMAAYGLATIAFTAVGWGPGPESQLQITETSGNVTTLPYPGRAIDANGDGTYDPGAGCTLLAGPSPIGNRDCTRQTTIDLLQLARAIKAGIDLDRDGANDLDPARIYYAGYSLGAFYGTLFTALAPDVSTAVLAAGGGSFADIRTWSTGPERARSRTMLGSLTPNLLNRGTDFDPDYVLRYRPPEIIDVPGALAIQEFFERFEWLAMPGDPIAYAPHLRWSTLPGVPIKRVLFQYGRGDRTLPNPAETALVRAANMRDTTSLYRHDLARTLWPDLIPNAHLFLFRTLPPVYMTNPFGQYVMASLALDQQAGFLASGGTVIPNENVWSRMWFGLDLFETPPAFLPEDLGF